MTLWKKQDISKERIGVDSMLENLNHSGYIKNEKNLSQLDNGNGIDSSVDLSKHFAYEYKNGEIIIHAVNIEHKLL